MEAGVRVDCLAPVFGSARGPHGWAASGVCQRFCIVIKKAHGVSYEGKGFVPRSRFSMACILTFMRTCIPLRLCLDCDGRDGSVDGKNVEAVLDCIFVVRSRGRLYVNDGM